MDTHDGCDISLTRMINDKFVIDSGGKRRASESGASRLTSRMVPQTLAFLSYDSDFSWKNADEDKENATPSKLSDQDYASRDSGFENSSGFDGRPRFCDYDMRDLEREFGLDDRVGSKYEIISTDSPGGATAATLGSIVASDFQFGSPIDSFGECEASESFDAPRPTRKLPPRSETTRALDFDSGSTAVRFEFLSPSILPLKGNFFSLKRSNRDSPMKCETPTRGESPFGSGCKKMRVDFDSPLGRYEREQKPSRLFDSPGAEFEECMFDVDDDRSAPSVPASFQSLISGEIQTAAGLTPVRPESFVSVRPALRRCLSLQTESGAERVRAALFQSPNRSTTKRAEMAVESSLLSKRRKSHGLQSISERPIFGAALQRTLSENEATMALTEAYDDANLIGDFSRPFCLPLENSQHQDLKAISGDTLAALVDGLYKDTIDSYQVIDCRYPYEFEGGHIVGAKNLFTEELVQKHLLSTEVCTSAESPQRRVLVFHCEFSFERGPKLCRFLRRADRALNRDAYPSLIHPEMYVLRGGYRGFHAQYARHCLPIAGGYTSMSDPRHAPALKRHRSEASKRAFS